MYENLQTVSVHLTKKKPIGDIYMCVYKNLDNKYKTEPTAVTAAKVIAEKKRR